jgi:hypothetical protein
LQGYIDTLCEVARDLSSGLVTYRYQGALQLGVMRASGAMRGPMGHDWVLIQYRLSLGHWVTAFQPELGLRIVDEPHWTDVQWLRQPTSTNVS